MLKKKLRRLSAMLMAGVMAVSMFGTAFADETAPIDAPDYEAKDVYVLNYSGDNIPGYSNFDNKRLYDTPYRTDIWVDEGEGEMGNWNWCTGSVLNMINSDLIDPSTEATSPYASIPVYCVDAITDGRPGFSYRRVNLEDSTYFDDHTAGRIRAIFMNSFPHIEDMAVITAAVNKWNTDNNKGFAEVMELNKYEVLSATQSVIWTITNNGYLSEDAYAGFAYGRDSETVYQDHDLVSQTAYTRNNINAVARYLEALAPMAPQGELISSASFEDAQVTYAEAADGTLTATVKAKVHAEVQGDTALTLTAVCEGKAAAATAVQNGTKTYTMTIDGLSAVSEISLAIDGVQENGDVYLFDPIDGREASQTMAGYDESALPVHAEYTIVKDERILNIHKIGKVENPDKTYTSVDLANIVFDVYFVGTLNDYLSGKVAISEEPTAEGLTQVASLKTDENGEASLNLTRKGLEDGVYLVIEKQSAATTTESLTQPFYVMLPYTSDSGDSWEYVINAQPKNILIGGPEIEKDVTKLDNNSDTFDVGEAHTWIISADKPADIADGIKYEITDKLDSRLDFVADSVKVAVEAEAPLAETTVSLVADTDYVAAYDAESHTLVVSLTDAGMDKAAAASGNYIRVYFDTKINDKAGMDEQIPNQATLQYTNSTNYTYDAESDKPEVHTGGFCLVKVDGASKEGDIYTNSLAGAEFTLYRDATEAEIATAVEIKLENGEAKKVVAITELISDEKGAASYTGLAYGTYYLVETKAPAGYNLLLHPVVVTIGTGTSTAPVTVENFSGFELPETGGIGTTVYTLMGSMTMAASSMYIFLKKRED